MGIFNNLMSKIFSHAGQPAPASGTTTAASGTAASGAPTAATPGAGGSAPAAGQPAAAPRPTVDVAQVLDGLAAKNSEKLDWKHSIVDLLKLVGMDSSLGARKTLASELHYTGDTNDSATMNQWLSKEVIRKMAENGGKVPADLMK